MEPDLSNRFEPRRANHTGNSLQRELRATVSAGSSETERKARFRWTDRETGARVLVEVGGSEEFLSALEACGFDRLAQAGPGDGELAGRRETNDPAWPSRDGGCEAGSGAGRAIRRIARPRLRVGRGSVGGGRLDPSPARAERGSRTGAP
ncbi:MAG: hypothetical protein CMJ84_16195 [Planctomycetes bacterium]|nr:hypothetical protein [Planctomycetota bacterium]